MITYYDYELYKKYKCAKYLVLRNKNVDVTNKKQWYGQEEKNKVKEESRKYVKGGILVENNINKKECAQQTEKYLKLNNVVYNASFIYEDIYVKCDIVEVNDYKSIDIYLVNSSQNIYEDGIIKSSYLEKLAFSYYAIENLGYEIKHAYILYINKGYKMESTLDVKALFKKEDIKKYIIDRLSQIKNDIKKDINDMKELIRKDSDPESKMIKYCIESNGCEYKEHCWKIPKDSIFDISGSFRKLSYDDKINLYKQGITTIRDVITKEKLIKDLYNKTEDKIKEDKKLSSAAKRLYFQLHCELSKDKEDYCNKGEIERFIYKFIDKSTGKVKYPLYFLDFEFVNLIIPSYKGTHSKEEVVFQFSLHYIDKNGSELKHLDYIGIDCEDPEKEIAKKLTNNILHDGYIIVKNKTTEYRILKKLLGENVKSIEDNILDIEEIFKKGYYYKKGMGPSNGLKDIVKVLLEDDKTLNRQNNLTKSGINVIDRYIEYNYAPNKIEKHLIEQDLLDYCYLDTLSIVKILDFLMEKVGCKNRLAITTDVKRERKEIIPYQTDMIWKYRNTQYTEEEYKLIQYIIDKNGIDESIASIIAQRNNFDYDEIDFYLDPKLNRDIDLKDMDKAVKIINQLIKENKKIRIVGDYDVDGVTSTYILLLLFKAIGYDNVDYYIPERKYEGYGLKNKIIEDANKDNIDLIITVDNGISSIEAIQLAKELNISVIITDHHEPLDIIPCADAIIDPKQIDCKYKYKTLTGGGIAYKLSQAIISDKSINKDINDRFYKDGYHEKIVSLAAMATVCDVADLLGENRAIVKQGLEYLNNESLKAVSNLSDNISVETLGFQVGPRLNACGRMKDAKIALEYLMLEDVNEIYKVKDELEDLNEERKAKQEEGKNRIIDKIYGYEKLPDIIVEVDEDAHEGIVGLSSGKIKEDFNRPTIVFTKAKSNIDQSCVYKGSGRSLEEYNLFKNIKPHLNLILGGGGHSMACGLSAESIEQIDKLRNLLNQNSKLTEEDKQKKIIIDKYIDFDDAILKLCKDMCIMEPCGTGNPRANICIKDVHIEFYEINNNKKIAKVIVYKDNKSKSIYGMCWNERVFRKYSHMKSIKGDIVTELFLNDENEIKINLKDIKIYS